LSAAFLLTLILSASPLLAALGGGADSVAADRKALKGVQRSAVTGDRYSVQELSYDSTTVREYLSPAGVVFAIAWDGFLHPDLSQLLGSYASEYDSARQRTPRHHGRKRARIATGNVVVEKWGHMRALRGRAYLPSAIPSGVTIDEIK
jgi:hypothetical protein